jgi:hypothetical protein
MAKKKTKKNKVTKTKVKKEKKLKLGTFKETAREKLIGQHIGYRFKFQMSKKHPLVDLKKAYLKF